MPRGAHTPELEGELDEDGVTKVKVGGDQLPRTALQRETAILKTLCICLQNYFLLIIK